MSRLGEQHEPPGPYGRQVGTVLLAVDGADIGEIHHSVLVRVANVAERLGCRQAARLGSPPVHFEGAEIRALRRELEQVVAFADAARHTGWTLGRLTAAPSERAVPVADTPQGRLWVHPARGFELHNKRGVRKVATVYEITHLDEPAPLKSAAPDSERARRVPLGGLLASLTEAAAGEHQRIDLTLP